MTTDSMSTVYMKTAILALLAFKALLKEDASPRNCTNFKILKTRNKRNVRTANKKCDPAKT